MNEENLKDKMKYEEIINEIANLKKYSRELANNTRGEKLENYIDILSKNINNLDICVDNVYRDNYDIK